MLTIHLVLLVTAYFTSGYYIAKRFFRENLLLFIALIFGFILLNGIFIISYTILKDIQESFYVTVGFLLISSIYTIVNIKNIYKAFRINFNLKLVSATLVAIVLISWPMFFIESKYYLHSGADDLIGDVYHQVMTLINEDKYSFGVYLMHSVQYFSPTLSSMLLGSVTIANILLLDIIFLGLYFLAIYYFASLYLNISRNTSLGIGFFAVVSNFYASTYINYHPGTLIAVPLMIIFTTMVLKSDSFTKGRLSLAQTIIFSTIFIVFIAFTYNIMILMFFLLPFLYIYIVKKLGSTLIYSKISIILLSSLYILACFLFYYYLLNYTSYLLFEDIFTLEYAGYRQWELLRSEFLFAFYWGIIPSMLMGVGYPWFEYYNFWILKYIIVFTSLLITFLSIYGIYLLSKTYEYIKYFALNTLLFFIPFLFLLDPYYTYKLLYITHGIFIIGLYVGCKGITQKIYKSITLYLLISLAVMNILYLFMMAYDLIDRPAHKFEQYKELENLKIDYKIGLTNLENKNILEYIHNITGLAYKIDTNSNNILIHNFKQDITDKNNLEYGQIIYKGNFYTAFEFGNNYLLSTDKYKQVEQYNNMPLRWIYDDLGLNRTIISELNFEGSSDQKYLKFHAYPGESAMKGLDLKVLIDDEQYEFRIVGETIVDVPLKKMGNFNLKIYTNEKGISMFPKEQRKLLVMISRVSFSNELYSIADLIELNPKDDVANQDFTKDNNIVIGNGWYPQELPDMRWGSSNLELLVLNTTKDTLKIEFDLEPGPSLQNFPLKVEILNEQNHKIGYIETDKRENLTVEIPVKLNERYQVIKLKVLNESKKLSIDPRDLNFRLFSIKVIK